MSLIIDPSTLSPTAWYVADSVTGVDGSAVDLWPDSSGNSYNLLQDTGANQPKVYLNVRNMHRGILFDGIDDYMLTNVDQPMALFLGAGGVGTVVSVIAFKPSDSTANHGLWGEDTAAGTQQFLAYPVSGGKSTTSTVLTGSGSIEIAVSAPLDFRASEILPEYRYHVVCWQHDTQVMAWNDSLDTAAAASVAAGADTGLANAVTVGRSRAEGSYRYLGGYIFEVIFFNTALTEAQRQGVQLYLTNKYAIAYGSSLADEGGATAAVKVEMKLPTSTLTLTPSAWFKADALGSTNTAPVSAWADASTEAHNLAQAASTSQPVYYTNIINSLPAVLFKGRDFLATTGLLYSIFSEGGQGTVYAVARPFTAGTSGPAPLNHVVWSSVNPGTSAASGMVVKESSSGTHALWGYWAGTTMNSATVAVASSTFGIYAWLHGPLEFTASYIAEHVPGFDWTSTGMTVSTGTSGLADLGNALFIGAGTTGTYDSFYLAELLCFRERHTQLERRHVHAYLSGKYGISYFSYAGSTEYEPVWLDMTTDIRADNGLSFNYGIDGVGPENRVASGGRAQFSMNNSAANSAGVIGYYSPDSTGKRNGWTIGVPVRISFDYYGTTYTKWLGKITDLLPSLDREHHATRVTAMDYVDELARTTLWTLDVQTNKRFDEAVSYILVNIPRYPTSYVIGEGINTYPYIFDNARDENILVLAEVNRLVQSEFGFAYMRGDADGGGELVFEPRGARDQIVRWAISDSYIRDMSISYNIDDIINRALVRLHPRRVDAAATSILFSLGNTPQILAGESLSFNAPYRDPDNGRYARVGGMDMVTPASTTDYTANTSSAGGGVALTTGFSVVATFGGNSADLVVTNGATQDGYLTKCQLRGRGLYSFEEVIIKAESTPSIDLYGPNTANIDMLYQSDANLGYQVATSIVANNKDPRTRITSISIQPGKSSVVMMNALAREPGDRVSITESVSGIAAAEYHIQGVEFKVGPASWMEVDWRLSPALSEVWSTSA